MTQTTVAKGVERPPFRVNSLVGAAKKQQSLLPTRAGNCREVSRAKPSQPAWPSYRVYPVRGSQEILLIDANHDLCTTLAEYLVAYGYGVTAAFTGRAGIEHLVPNRWQAIILDLALPDQDGFAVLRCIRSRCDTPILVHTILNDELDVVAALEAGADGFLHKGGCARHLLARLHAIVRRATVHLREAAVQEIVIAGLRIVPESRVVTLRGQAVALTPGEFDILHSLARAAGRVKTRDGLLVEIRHRAYEVFDRAIDVQVSSLRRKLGDDPKQPRFIRTVRSAGYMFVSPDAP